MSNVEFVFGSWKGPTSSNTQLVYDCRIRLRISGLLSTVHPHLVYVPYIHINVGGTQDSYSQCSIDGPQ